MLADNVAYAAGPSGAWIVESKLMTAALSALVIGGLTLIAIRGMSDCEVASQYWRLCSNPHASGDGPLRISAMDAWHRGHGPRSPHLSRRHSSQFQYCCQNGLWSILRIRWMLHLFRRDTQPKRCANHPTLDLSVRPADCAHLHRRYRLHSRVHPARRPRSHLNAHASAYARGAWNVVRRSSSVPLRLPS